MPIQKSAFISYRAKFQSKKRLSKGVFFDADPTKGIATICLMDYPALPPGSFFLLPILPSADQNVPVYLSIRRTGIDLKSSSEQVLPEFHHFQCRAIDGRGFVSLTIFSRL